MNDLPIERAVDLVLAYLANHKNLAISELFGESEPSYREEWRQRDALKFWAHLDLGNRRRLVELSATYYGYAG